MNVEERVVALEKEVNALNTRVTVNERDINNINRKLDKIDSNTSKLLWIVITAVVAALLKLVISGGI